MINVFVRLRKYIVLILIIIAILVVQAKLDLLLPDYMAKMIDVGISRYGIEENSYKVLTENSYNKIYKQNNIVSKYYSKENNYYILSNKLDDNVLTLIKVNDVDELREYTISGYNIKKSSLKYILKLSLKMILVTIFSVFCIIAVSFLTSKVSIGFGKELRSDLYKKIIKFSFEQKNKFSVSTLITRTTNDVNNVIQIISAMFRLVIYSPILAVGAVFKIFALSFEMSWIVGIVSFVSIVIFILIFKFVIPKYKKVQRVTDIINLSIRETLSGSIAIKSFNNEDFHKKRFDRNNDELRNEMLSIFDYLVLLMPLIFLIMNLSVLLIIYVSAKNIESGTMYVGNMMAFIQYQMQIIFSILLFSIISFIYPKASVSANRINEILEEKIYEEENKIIFSFNDSIELKNVYFKYPNSKKYVLEDINFVINKKEKIGIVGSIASSKTTIISLIEKFYNVTNGVILIDGINIDEYETVSLRKKISYCPQNINLIEDTILNNILYGEELNEKKLNTVLEISQVKTIIEEKKDLLDHIIQRGANNLSGGQKQRIAIARTLYKEADMYIFDDSFSSIDYNTSSLIITKMKEFFME